MKKAPVQAASGRQGGDRPPPPVYVLSAAASRRLDALAEERYALPTLLLMEHAGLRTSMVAMEMLEDLASSAVLIVAGPGNNGGDGLAAARLLERSGFDVHILTTAGEAAYQGPARTNMEMARRLGIPLTMAGSDAAAVFRAARAAHRPGLIVDALLGTGMTRPLSGVMLELVYAVNNRDDGSAVLSVDLPSGMDADTGAAQGACIKADATITLAAMKAGFLEIGAADYLGALSVADIGIPAELLAELGVPFRPPA